LDEKKMRAHIYCKNMLSDVQNMILFRILLKSIF
jgi:hypothetical protein